jgi:hypothetical protein
MPAWGQVGTNAAAGIRYEIVAYDVSRPLRVSLRTHLETPVGCDILFLGNNQEQESCDFVN